tara:strand:- start:239 stop:559 length:321 start_codon:yes stop_codon:yes gene_type:complete
MITGNMLIMFIVGFIIFCFYIAGLIYAIYWGHSTQREEMMNDPELRDYYNRHHNYDSEIDYDGGGNWGRFNPHADEKDDSYVKGLFRSKKRKSKKKQNVGKSTYWD